MVVVVRESELILIRYLSDIVSELFTSNDGGDVCVNAAELWVVILL